MVDLPQYDEVYCFLDTDVLMHFTDFDQADWVTLLSAKKVYLVLPITVVRELNKHKDDFVNKYSSYYKSESLIMLVCYIHL